MSTPDAFLIAMETIKLESPLWMEDGNLILTTSCTAFKVHRGILERHSIIFKDLLSLPQPDPAPEIGGVAAIRMHDDPKHLEYFLLALYDGLYFEQPRASNFPVIYGVLRLSIKYLVEFLRLECLKMLQHDWPMTLAGWDLREREATNSSGAYESALIRPHPILIINLVHELGAAGVTLLPAAFYDLSRYNCSHIWQGCPSLTPNNAGHSESTATNPINTARLSPADLQAVMVGKEASQSFIAQFLRQRIVRRGIAVLCENKKCHEGKVCRDAFDSLAHDMYRGIVGVTCGRDSDPLFTLNAAVALQRRENDGTAGAHPASMACEQCRAEFAQTAASARSYVWEQLPRWFGFDTSLWAGISRGITGDAVGLM